MRKNQTNQTLITCKHKDHCVSSFVFQAPCIIEVIPTIKMGQDIQAGSDGVSCLGTLFTNSKSFGTRPLAAESSEDRPVKKQSRCRLQPDDTLAPRMKGWTMQTLQTCTRTGFLVYVEPCLFLPLPLSVAGSGLYPTHLHPQTCEVQNKTHSDKHALNGGAHLLLEWQASAPYLPALLSLSERKFS